MPEPNKSLRRLSGDEIRDQFNAQKARFEKEHATNGLLPALEDISRAIADIKSAGYDVDLQIFGNPSEQAFAMFPRGGDLTTPLSGILRVGRNERLFAISTVVNGEKALLLAVSDFDIRYNGADGKVSNGTIDSDVRSKTFDLKNDPDAIVKFQKDILFHAARNEVINDRDVAQSFDNGARAPKPRLKVPPKPAA